MKELKNILKPLKIKIILEAYIKRFFITASICLGISIAVEIFSKFKQFNYQNVIYIILFIISFIAPIFIVIFKDKIDYCKTAKKCDALGYNERFITAYEILSKNDDINKIEKLAVEDAFLSVKNTNITKQYKVTLPKKMIIVFSVLAIAIVSVGFIKPYGKENFEIYIQKELEEIKKIEKEAEKNNNINKEQLKNVKSEIKELNEQLKKSVTKEDAKKALEKTEQELKKLEKDSLNKDISKLADELSKNEAGKNLAEALKNGNNENIQNAFNEFKQNIQNLDNESIKELSTELQKLIEQMASEDMKNVVNNMANNISNLSESDIKNIVSTLSQYSQEGKEIRNMIKNMNNQISNGKSDIQNSENENQSSASSGNGSGEGSGNNKGSGNQNGNGGNGNGASGGNGRGFGAGDHKEIYTRDAINKGSEDIKTNGVQNENGNINLSNESTIGSGGQSVPYTEVYNEYRQEALESMEKNNIPYGMRDMVTEYFSSLEE